MIFRQVTGNLPIADVRIDIQPTLLTFYSEKYPPFCCLTTHHSLFCIILDQDVGENGKKIESSGFNPFIYKHL
jgi:hypothetical protein